MIILLIYIAIFVAAFFIVKFAVQRATSDFTSLKTVTFGDESAVRPNRIASVVSVLTIFLLWGVFTGSSWVPGFLHAPGPFEGTATFEYNGLMFILSFGAQERRAFTSFKASRQGYEGGHLEKFYSLDLLSQRQNIKF